MKDDVIVDVVDLSKNYANKPVLNQVSFGLSKGQVLGIIGPNGSGKTTLLNIIMGMMRPLSGIVRIADSVRIGMSVSRKGFFDDMSVEKNLMLFARLHNISEKAVRETMMEFGIDFGHLSYGRLSAGMKQRVSLVYPFAMVNDLVLLDEPTNHLDIDSILLLRRKIIALKQAGVAFLLASHVVSDLERVCDQIIFLRNGRILENQPLGELLKNFGSLEDAYLKVGML